MMGDVMAVRSRRFGRRERRQEVLEGLFTAELGRGSEGWFRGMVQRDGSEGWFEGRRGGRASGRSAVQGAGAPVDQHERPHHEADPAHDKGAVEHLRCDMLRRGGGRGGGDGWRGSCF